MTRITLELPDEALPSRDKSAEQFARELRVAAAVHWYSRGEISQGKAARIAGMNRAEFIDELNRQKVPVTQVTIEELKRELNLE